MENIQLKESRIKKNVPKKNIQPFTYGILQNFTFNVITLNLLSCKIKRGNAESNRKTLGL